MLELTVSHVVHFTHHATQSYLKISQMQELRVSLEKSADLEERLDMCKIIASTINGNLRYAP
jgi:hypothetical protein